VVLSEELCILASCFSSLIRRNLVLEELRVKRFAVIQDDSSDEEHFGGE